jgi:hypothetical protein
MKQNVYYVGVNQCDEKWRRLLSRYRQVRDSSKKFGSGGIKWQYYESMRDALSPLARQAVSPPKGKIEFCVLTVALGSLIFLCLVLIIFLLDILIINILNANSFVIKTDITVQLH